MTQAIRIAVAGLFFLLILSPILLTLFVFVALPLATRDLFRRFWTATMDR